MPSASGYTTGLSSVRCRNRRYEVEEYLQNMLTCIHQVPQNSAGFSRLDSTSKPLTDEFEGHINLLPTAIYDKRFMTPKKIKKITFLLHLTARNEQGIPPLVCRESAEVEMIHRCKPSAWESEKYQTDADCKVNYDAVSQPELGKALSLILAI